MKQMILMFSLLIGVFFTAYGQVDDCPEYSPTIDLPDKCAECIEYYGDFAYFNTGGCQYGFSLWPRPPRIFPDDYCLSLGLSFTYSWDFDDGSLPTAESPSPYFLYTFTSNGTYHVCVTVRIYDSSHELVCCYQLCRDIVVDCVRCDMLDCSHVLDHASIGKDNIKFEFPLNNCEDCPNPEYRVGWKEKYAAGGWDYSTGITVTNTNEVEITGLEPCREYSVIIEVRCNGSSTLKDFCTFDFMTDGCMDDCEFDCDDVVVQGSDQSQMRFTFEQVSGDCPNCPDPYYNIGWKVFGSPGPWNYGSTTVGFPLPPATWASGSIWGLSSCTHYEFVLELKCPESSAPHPWQTPTVIECTGDFYTTCPFAAPGMPATPALPAFAMAYPNPAGSSVNIIVVTDIEAEGTIRIYNSLGVVVRQVASQTKITKEISVEDLSAGAYYYVFEADGNTDLRASGKLTILK